MWLRISAAISAWDWSRGARSASDFDGHGMSPAPGPFAASALLLWRLSEDGCFAAGAGVWPLTAYPLGTSGPARHGDTAGTMEA